MRYAFTLSLILLPPYGFGAGPTVELSDPGLPLQEIRPLDRRTFVLILDAKWGQPAAPITHYVNVRYPDGGSSMHRVLSDALFHRGEVRCMIPEHELIRHGAARRGLLSIVVSAREPADEGGEIVSNALAINWPLEREIVRVRQRSRFDDPLPVDVFPLPGPAMPPQKLPPPKKVPPQ